MRKHFLIGLLAVTCAMVVSGSRANAPQQTDSLLRLVRTISMPGVQDRLDHIGVDTQRQRLFVAALGEKQNTVEVVDLKMNKRTFSIPGQSKPQGVFYSPVVHRLFVANGTDGTCKIFEGDAFKLIESLPIGPDADHVGYDPATKILYIGSGDAKSGSLSLLDTRTNKVIGDIKTDARPGGIKFDPSGSHVFVTLTGTSNLGVVDRKQRKQVTTWPVAGVQGNVALALDEKHQRLFAGSRNPPMLTVLDTETGKSITQIEGVAGIDDLWYDEPHQRIYASGGRGGDVGFVYVYQQHDADHYELAGKVPTAAGAGTSLWVPQFGRLYVAAPASEKQEAGILEFEPQR